MSLDRALKVIADNSRDAILVLDQKHDVIYANKAMEKLVGLRRTEITDKTSLDIIKSIIPDFEFSEYQENFDSIFSGSNYKASIYRIEGNYIISIMFDNKTVERTNYNYFEEDVVFKKSHGKPHDKAGSLTYLGFHDALTGLYNRAFFEEELSRIDSGRNLPFAVIMGDLNCLKLVNDVFGHNAGDRLILSASYILLKCCRRDDVVVRWGGDEFIILLPQADEKAALQLCKRIRKKCSEYQQMPVKLSIALGYAVKRNSSDKIYDIMREAEDMMYSDKLLDSQLIKDSVIQALKKDLSLRGVESEHCTEVMKLIGEKVGKAAGLSETELLKLMLVIEYHDIGYAIIPDEIIIKQMLSDTDKKLIQKHSEKSYRIVEYSPQVCSAADAILSHHERFDGNGYPRGLKDKDIPLISRIFAIIDAFMAMVSDRPYRKAVPIDTAVQEIKKCAGSQFDPDITDIFLKILNENIDMFMQPLC